jgi:hypothetical protein
VEQQLMQKVMKQLPLVNRAMQKDVVLLPVEQQLMQKAGKQLLKEHSPMQKDLVKVQ